MQQEAEQLPKKTESETRARHQSERGRAESALEQTREEVQKRKQQEEKEILDHYQAKVRTAEVVLTVARNRTTEKQTKTEKHWKESQFYLIQAGFPLAKLIPVEIPSAPPEQFQDEEDPAQALQNSLDAVQETSKAIQSTVDELLHWRKTRRRIRNWVIGIAVVTTVVVLIGLSIRNAQVHEMARLATATAYYPTSVAIATSTAQAEATAQAQATATVQAILAARPPRKKFTVYANKGWQDTGMFVLARERLSIKYVAGTWNHCALNGCPDSRGEGAPGAPSNYPDNVIQKCTHFKLIARISGHPAFCTGVDYTEII